MLQDTEKYAMSRKIYLCVGAFSSSRKNRLPIRCSVEAINGAGEFKCCASEWYLRPPNFLLGLDTKWL